MGDLHTAFNVDGLTTSRPILAENVETLDDINALFDAITYDKAGSIIRMINRFAGDEAFKSGLKVYFPVCHILECYILHTEDSVVRAFRS